MKKMTIQLMVILLMVITVMGIAINNSEARLSGNNRRAVVLEAFYALRPSHDGSCDKTIDGNCVSNWNYLNNDWYAYNTVKGWYGGNSSTWSLFYSDVASYGYGTFGGSYGQVGRGGQCKYFSDLILYRSEASTRINNNHTLPSYDVMWQNTEPDLTKAVEGDVILTYNASTQKGHVAIVVEIKKPNGTITGLDVIDANYISDIRYTADREVIARHLFPISEIQGVYKIWKGPSYYYESYCSTC